MKGDSDEDALPTVNINAVAADPNYPSNVYIATPAGIFGSTDGGHVWALLNGQDLQGQGNDGGAFHRAIVPTHYPGDGE